MKVTWRFTDPPRGWAAKNLPGSNACDQSYDAADRETEGKATIFHWAVMSGGTKSAKRPCDVRSMEALGRIERTDGDVVPVRISK